MRPLLGICLSGAVLLAASQASAAVMQVTNPSFESPVLAAGGQSASVPNWLATTGSISTRRPVAGDVKQTNASFVTVNSSVLATDGSQVLKAAAGTDAYIPLTGYTLAPGQSWTISMDFAWPVDSGTSDRFAFLRLTTADNPGTFVAGAQNGAFSSAPISFGTNGWFTLNFTITTPGDAGFLSAFNGKTPVVLIRNTATDGSLYFDNLRGTTSAVFTVPEPASLMALGAAAGATFLRRRSRR